MGAPAERSMRIPVTSGAFVDADLVVPDRASGVVVFAHGSGSGRFSTRNRAVAEMLVSAGLATLLLDLLTPDEERRDELTAEHRFDIPLLADRVLDAIAWLSDGKDARGLAVGLFGASTGAGAALAAAAERPEVVRAVVSRGGRPDLAGDALERVAAPTLLIVGGSDAPVLELNREAAARMRKAECELRIVPGATHLFPEPGALEAVAQMARDWFLAHLGPPEPEPAGERA